jgi:hypothetical protein
MEATLTQSLTKAEIEVEFEEVTEDLSKAVHLLEASPKYPSRYTPPFETLVPTNTTLDICLSRRQQDTTYDSCCKPKFGGRREAVESS